MYKKIALTLTAAVLSTAGIFAYVKKATPSALYAKNIAGTGSCFNVTTTCIPSWLTSSPGTYQATIRSGNGGRYNLFSTSTCGSSHKVYFK